ncbi:MAG: hypothetical protein ACPG6V_01525 [Flavobacteriales bacterium]
MNKKIGTILGVVVLVLMAVGLMYYVQILSNGDDAFADKDLQDSIIGPAITYTKFLLYAIVGLIAIFTLMNLGTNPKQLVGAGIGIGGCLLIYFIATGQASSDILPSYEPYFEDYTKEEAANVTGNVGTGLIAFYWMAGIAFVGAIVGEVVNGLK